MPHVLRALHLGQWEQELSGPVWTQIIPPTFFPDFFSHTALVFFHLYVQMNTQPKIKESLLQLFEALPLCSLFFFALSFLSSEFCLLDTAKTLVFVSVSLPHAMAGNFLQTVSRDIYWVHLVYLSFPWLLLHTVYNVCKLLFYIFHLVLSWFKVRR